VKPKTLSLVCALNPGPLIEPCTLERNSKPRINPDPLTEPWTLDPEPRLLNQDELVPKDVEMIVSNIGRAMKLYENKSKLREVQIAAMAAAKTYSWNNAAREYISHFIEIGSPISA